MKIPIANTLYESKNNFSYKSKIDEKILNKLSFKKVDVKKFPAIKLIKKLSKEGYSAPIIVNAANEVLVDMFLDRRIGFLDIVSKITKIFQGKLTLNNFGSILF